MPQPKAQYKLTQLIKDIKDKDTKELRKKFKYKSKELIDHIDWAAYNQAQLMELDNQLILIRNMVDEAANRIRDVISTKGREGRPPKNAANKAKAILVQQYFMATDRFAASLVWFLREKLGITEMLTAKDIERAYDDSDAIAILIEVFRMSNEPVRDKETRFSIDGSGMPTSIKQNYANDKDDKGKKAVYDMLIGMIGVNTKLFTACDIVGPGSESPYLKPLLEETSAIYEQIDSVTADAMYLSKDNCTAIANAGGVPYIFPKENTQLNQKGSMAWKKMLLALIDDPQKWLEEYHMRSISESVNSVWKRKYTRPLARKGDDRRKIEAFSRVVCYNIRRLPYLHYLHDISIPWMGH